MRPALAQVGTWLFRLLLTALVTFNGGVAVTAARRGLHQAAVCIGLTTVSALWLVSRANRTKAGYDE